MLSDIRIIPLNRSSASLFFFSFFFSPQSPRIEGIIAIVASHRSRFSETSFSPFQRQLSLFYRGEMDLFDSALIDSREKKNVTRSRSRLVVIVRSCTWHAIFLRTSLCSFSPFSLKKGKIDSKRRLFL